MSLRKHDIPDELLSHLSANYQKPEDLIGENGQQAADQAACWPRRPWMRR